MYKKKKRGFRFVSLEPLLLEFLNQTCMHNNVGRFFDSVLTSRREIVRNLPKKMEPFTFEKDENMISQCLSHFHKALQCFSLLCI